jgi:hypothetical protein
MRASLKTIGSTLQRIITVKVLESSFHPYADDTQLYTTDMGPFFETQLNPTQLTPMPGFINPTH